jgi:Flp pilus assembly pilin Flp
MRLFRIVRETEAQDLAEYAILLTLISLALIAALTLIGVNLSDMFTDVANAF